MALANMEEETVLLYTEPSGARTNTSNCVESAARFSSLTVPFTFNLAVGLFVPIPILPLASIRNASLLFVFMINGCPSSVPKKLLAGLVPLLPVNDQLALAAAMSAIFFQYPLLLKRRLLSALR